MSRKIAWPVIGILFLVGVIIVILVVQSPPQETEDYCEAAYATNDTERLACLKRVKEAENGS